MTQYDDTNQNDTTPIQQDTNVGAEEQLEAIASSVSGTDDVTLEQQVTLLQEALARSQADYQNLVMRTERDRSDMVHFLSAKILAPLLSEVDKLERAVNLKADVQGDTFVDGVRSVYSGFLKYLESQKVTPFDSIGNEVDPDRHDVMTQGAGPEGKIVSEFEKGYLLGDVVLRHAKVIVGSGE